jgi:dolichyl-phosphate-mannose--protein O-mannosyl transferase
MNFPRDIKNFDDPLLYYTIPREDIIRKSETSKGKTLNEPLAPPVYRQKEPSGNFLQKFVQTHKDMSLALVFVGGHPYSSGWWEWPIGRKPIMYANIREDSARFILMGNPIVWISALLGIISIFFIPIYRKKKDLGPPYFFKNPDILYFYFFSWLPYIFAKRTTYLFYYLLPLCFSIIIFALCFDFYTKKISKKRKNILWAILIIACLVSFLFYAPLTFGTPLSEAAFQSRFWLPIWSL